MLVEHGTDVSAQTMDRTPLQLASSGGSCGCGTGTYVLMVRSTHGLPMQFDTHG